MSKNSAQPPPMAGAFPANATAHADGILLEAVSRKRVNSVPPTSAVGAVQVDLYVDFHSGPCQRFEAAVGSTLDEMVGAGDISLAYHPVAVLDALSTTRYSSRAAASSGCASDGGRFREYVRALFAHQPPEYSAGLTNDELVEIGAKVGLTDSTFAECVRTEHYEEWTIWVTVQAGDRGVNWWPTVHVAAEPVRANADAIRAAVRGAASAHTDSAWS
jgi:protein-disulfide isomerase